MKRLVQLLPPGVEFAVVIGLSLGYFILGSIASLFIYQPGPPINDAGLLGLLFYEPPVFAMVFLFLRARGWTLARLGLQPGVRDTLIGLSLTVTFYGVFVALWYLVASLSPGYAERAADQSLVGGHIALWTVLLVSAVNPVFEEVFVCAYVIEVLKPRRGLWFAINVSTALRLSYHLYQGASGVLTIVPLGLLLGYWYGRSGRLWPAVVVHAIIDFTGLISFVGP